MAGDESATGDVGSATPPVSDAPAAPKTRRRVSGAELEGRFDDWASRRHERREARTPEDRARAVRRVLVVAMGAGLLAVVVATGLTGEGYSAEQAGNADRIAGLNKQIAESQAVPAAPTVDPAALMTALTAAASDDAKKVAAGQQAFAVLARRASTEPSPSNGTPNKAFLDAVDQRKALAPLFDKGSYLVDDDEAYSPSSLTPFDEQIEIDPRFPWYVRYDGEKAADSGTYAWGVETVMPDIPGRSSTTVPTDDARVIWTCRDAASKAVLAWASAKYSYDGTTGIFSDLEVVVTITGAQYLHTVTTTENGDQG